MLEGTEVQNAAVTSEAPAVESAPIVAQAETITPPAGEKPVIESKPEEGKIPYSRFSEVIDQRNKEKESRVALEARIKDLEAKSQRPQRSDIAEAEVKRLVSKLGMSEEAAREVVQSSQAVARSERGDIEARIHSYEIDAWTRSMRDKYSDFKDMEPVMEKAFGSLDPQDQQYIISSPKRLEMFYKSTKADLADFVAKEAFEKGKKAAYDTKGSKEAVSSVPGSAAQPQKGKLTAELIKGLSSSEYKARQSEINDWVVQQSK